MHVHTVSSPDAEIPAKELCAMAGAAAVERIGFVAHLDLHPLDFCHGGFSETVYLEELDRAEEYSDVEVLRGIEIGEPHRFFSDAALLFDPSSYDFLTGALHWIGNELILDESPFLTGQPLPLIEQYYRETLEIISSGNVNIIAHMGIFRRGMARAGISTNIDETQIFPGLVREVLSASIDAGVAIELNTSGLRRDENTTYPEPGVLRLYRSMGGNRITLGSDTHKPEHAFYGLERGKALLEGLGFREYGIFRSGEYFQCPLHSQVV